MINIREKVRETRRKFYINGCIVLDKCFHKTKKQICENEIIKYIYYERDKDAAHKDDKYMKKQYSSMMEIAEDMKIQVQSIREVCKDFLPDNLTLDFLVFDSDCHLLLHNNIFRFQLFYSYLCHQYHNYILKKLYIKSA